MRNTISLLLAIFAAPHFAIATPVGELQSPVVQADIETLLAGGVLTSADGTFEYDNFHADGPSASELPDLTLTANSNGMSSSLLFQLGGESRIFTAGESIDLDLAFRVVYSLPQVALTEVSLDMRGGTTGTTGSATVQVTEIISNSDSMPLSILMALEAQDEPPTLFDQSTLMGGSQWLVQIHIQSNGGTDINSVAVLTDFVANYTVSVVPEPTSMTIALLLCVCLAASRFFPIPSGLVKHR